MGELAGKVALVTGAARGLGAATAEVFLREGASVVLTDVLAEDGKALAERLGQKTRFIAHDVTKESDWARAVEFAQSAFGKIDVLVNNAGVSGIYTFDQTTPALWEKFISIMETGPYLGMRAVIPVMQAAGSGAIVNVSSTNGVVGMARTSAYTAAKHGLIGLTKSIALEFAPQIRINTVCPGPMRTEMLREAFGAKMDTFGEGIPAGRLSEPREVAEMISFLASPRASYCYGGTFVVDGGLTVG